mmetsp:Transcript_46502/g.129604  ORF Transcript_46502/g.129604 Transcript_46502/m.129604 type:complete len:582 (-) Transcript_46502:2923-4668(-)
MFYHSGGIVPALEVFRGIGYDYSALDDQDLYSCQEDTKRLRSLINGEDALVVCPTLAEWLSADTNSTLLAANLDVSRARYLNETAKSGKIKKWDVKHMDGGLVGFVGFAQNMMHTNEAFKTHIEVGGAWTVPNRCAWEPDIPEQDCDAMTIESQQDDIALALHALAEAHPDVGVIILYGPQLQSVEYVKQMAYRYPTVDAIITGGYKDGRGTSTMYTIDGLRRVVASGNKMSECSRDAPGCMDHLSLKFDEVGALLNYSHASLLLDDAYEADDRTWPYLWTAYNAAHSALATPVGYTSIDLDGDRGTYELGTQSSGCYRDDCTRGGCRRGDCPMGRLVNAAMMHVSGSADLALTNSGSIRNGIPRGNVSYLNIKRAVPFDNSIVDILIKGLYIRELIESVHVQGATDYHEYIGGDEDAGYFHGHYPQWFGLRWAYNPRTDEVINIEVFEKEAEHWSPLDDAKGYTLVTSSFLARGGDFHDLLAEYGTPLSSTGLITADAVMKFFEDHPRIEEGMTIPEMPGVALKTYADADYFACTNNPEFSSASLPLSSHECSAIITSMTLDDVGCDGGMFYANSSCTEW